MSQPAPASSTPGDLSPDTARATAGAAAADVNGAPPGRTLADAVARLEAIFARERAAVVALDLDAMARIADDKHALMADLERLAARLARSAADNPAGSPAPRLDPANRIRALVDRALAHAEANVALLGDAIGTLGELLGLRTEPITYDARARLVPSVRPIAGKNV